MKLPIYLIICLSFFSAHLTAQSKLDYGKTTPQIKILNLDCLHQRGFTGKGVTIAHFDDGFDKIMEIEAFKYAREKGLMKGEFDFVFNKEDIDDNKVGSHGLETTSVVNGYLPGEYIGTAFDANILLAHTEDNRTEKHIEEENWKRAVDWAIDNNADIITSSLQYNEFDKGEGNYTYDDMDGKTTIITKAAEYAASKGVLVVAIQGNFGADDWYYVAAPGDAPSVITVGAVGETGKKADFSSFGPTSDGRVKPDVVAVGYQTQLCRPNGSIGRGNGTSYAGPAIAGLTACLMQAHPERSNQEIISAIRQSADRYLTPDIKGGFGYGIPDACKADDLLTAIDEMVANQNTLIKQPDVSYRVFNNALLLSPVIKKKNIKAYTLFTSKEDRIDIFSKKTKSISLADLPKGHLLLKILMKDGSTLVKNIYNQ